MKTTLVMVQSINGKITNGADPDIYKWTSKEDSDHFFSLLKEHSLILMGRKTYEASRKKIVLDEKRLRIVLTSDPAKFVDEEEKGKLEFVSGDIEELIAKLETRGYNRMLLVGGGGLNSLFFEKGLVDELYVTIEPIVFGIGLPIIEDGSFSSKFRLIASTKLNEKGSLLLHYLREK
jgi:dihydrofolate reductase